MSRFLDLNVHPLLVKQLSDMGIEQPTPIQQNTMPYLINKGGDFIGMAQTGTGKTAAYGIPLLQRINVKQSNIQGLILAPTRELVQQIAKALFKYTKFYQPIYTIGVYGGPHLNKQINALKKPTHIVVATPGRLIDLINRRKIDLAYLKYLILDEADEMLKLGFKEDLDFILTAASGNIQKWLFSATMPKDIESLVKKHLYHQAKKIIISEGQVLNAKIRHQYISTSPSEKLNVLIKFLSQNKSDQGIVFCKTKKTADIVYKQLILKGHECGSIHGDLSQLEREKVMRQFRNKSLSVLISTDISARGIDIDDLAYVLHYEMPSQTHYYTHRSGRTARGGKSGQSIALVDEKELKFLKSLSQTLSFDLEETMV